MRRDDHSQLESSGQDSFLDVTTNIVGIPIILVMVVGMRAQNPIVQLPAAVPSMDELHTLETHSAEVEYDARRIGKQLDILDQEIAGRTSEREALATLIAAAEKEIGDRRAKFDAAQQEEFDLRSQLEQSRAAVAHDDAELDALYAQKPPVQQVNHYPT